MIPESFIQELLNRVDIIDVVGKYVPLRKGGANFMGLCPFHEEKTPSFSVNPSKQFFHCFGCGKSGSAITFLMDYAGQSFQEAVQTLANTQGLVVPEERSFSPQKKAEFAQKKKQEESLHQLLEAVQKHYVQSHKNSPDAIQYLKGRGLTGITAKQFGIGWAGADSHDLDQLFPDSTKALVESGVVIENESGRRYNRFRERVMFPIRDIKGHLIGFGGRIIGKGEPKYLNSPETSLFNKGQELYGAWENRHSIRREGMVVVVEGYMDVVGMAQNGLNFAVATLGTATTEFHLKKLMRLSQRVIFCFDGDQAGQRAAWKALKIALPLLRDDITFRFLFLPKEHDPDSYVKAHGANSMRQALKEAMALSNFFLNHLSTSFNLHETEGRMLCLHEARPLLSSITNTTIALQFQKNLAPLLRMTQEELAQDLEQYQEKNSLHTPQKAKEDIQPSIDSQSPFSGMSPHSSLSKKNNPIRQHKSTRIQYRVTPLAKRLLALLLQHPYLAHKHHELQLEILSHAANMNLVRELLALLMTISAENAAAVMNAVDKHSELYPVLNQILLEQLPQEGLPHAEKEWQDALYRVEIDVLKGEQNQLISKGLHSEQDKQRYQFLNGKIQRLTQFLSQ